MTGELIPPAAPEFLGKFHRFRYSAFRLETLQSYGNSGEDADFEAFVAGRPKPANPGHEQWQAMVRTSVAACRWRDAALHQAMSWRDYLAARPELARHVPTPEIVS